MLPAKGPIVCPRLFVPASKQRVLPRRFCARWDIKNATLGIIAAMPKYPWALNIVSIGLLKMIKGVDSLPLGHV